MTDATADDHIVPEKGAMDYDAPANAGDPTAAGTAPAHAQTVADEDDHTEDQDAQAAQKAEEKIQELTGDLQRIGAEFANYRKRVQREVADAREQGKATVLHHLLAIADDIDRANQHGDLAEGSALKAFSDKFLSILTTLGVQSFGAEGDEFDANVHEAIQDEGGDGDRILSTVLRKGYSMGDRVLRTAMVMVKGAGLSTEESVQASSEETVADDGVSQAQNSDDANS